MDTLKSSLILRLVLPGECATKKNSEHIAKDKDGNQFIAPDPRYKKWEKKNFAVVRDWMKLQAEKHQLLFPLAQIRIKCRIFFGTLRRKDGLGASQALGDLLQLALVIGDDQWINLSGFNWEATLDRKDPRVELWIHVLRTDCSIWEEKKVKRIQQKNKKYTRKPKFTKAIIQ